MNPNVRQELEAKILSFNPQDAIDQLGQLSQDWELTPVRGKKPYKQEWQKTDVDRDTIATEIESGKATGYGLRLGEPSGWVAAIDFDGQSAIDFGLEKFGELPQSVSWTSGKPGRFQVLFQIPEDWRDLLRTRKIKTGEGEGLEFRYTGGQSVLPPSLHPDTGKPYQWIASPEDSEVIECPIAVLEFFREFELEEKGQEFERDRTSGKYRPLPNIKPISDGTVSLPAIPIERVLAKSNKNNLHGVKLGSRDDCAIALARDLLGVEATVPQIEFDYRGNLYRCEVEGNPFEVFENFCASCSPPLSAKDCDRVWRSARKYPPEPAINNLESLKNCLRGWAKEVVPKPERTIKESRKKGLQAEENSKYERLAKELGLNLVLDEDGNVKSKLNILKMNLFEMFGSRLEFNEMEMGYELDRKQIDINNAKNFISEKLGEDYSTENCILAIHAIAKRHSYHPVREYLDSLDRGLVDDEFLSSLAATFLGNSDPLANKMVRKKLIAAVARVKNPGAKDDTLLVLKGKQGENKSSGLAALAGWEWFNDDLRDLENKDELAKLPRFWVFELAEVDYLFGKKEVEQFKRFLSATSDTYRPPYGRANVRTNRTCCFFATTNKSEFLNDPTGDRRYWVVEVQKKIDVELVQKYRDMIWSSALAAYERGENWWLEGEDETKRSQSHEQYRESDPWLDFLGDLPLTDENGGEYTTTSAIFDRLDIPPDRRDRRTSNRITKILTEMGFVPKALWDKERGKAHKVWWRSLPSLPSDKKIGNEQNTCTEPVLPYLPNLPSFIEDKKGNYENKLPSHGTDSLSEKNKNEKNNFQKTPIGEKLGKEGELGKNGSESDLHALPSEKKIGNEGKEGKESRPKVGDRVRYVGGFIRLRGKSGKITKLAGPNVFTDFSKESIPFEELEAIA